MGTFFDILIAQFGTYGVGLLGTFAVAIAFSIFTVKTLNTIDFI